MSNATELNKRIDQAQDHSLFNGHHFSQIGNKNLSPARDVLNNFDASYQQSQKRMQSIACLD
jgi:hypothetical protein